jgi:dTDP-4-amino-4,6-dideoxygalactose transaminase
MFSRIRRVKYFQLIKSSSSIAHGSPASSQRPSADWVPILRPRLPDANALLPYLQKIDHNRIYTNWGPLSGEFERRLAAHWRLPDHSVVSASSGTAALVGAILASAGRARPDRPLALIPAYTFVATALAAEQCGYQPHFVDVDVTTWQLDFDRLNHALLDRAGVVIPVAPFGRAVAQAACVDFRRRTGIPVVIDAGASFELLGADPSGYIGDVPAAMSFHATKSFSTGEGGCVVVTDRNQAQLVTQSLNFGFYAKRECVGPSTNGKMSEYHAAVGLAELDGWPTKQRALCEVAERYRKHFSSAGLIDRFITTPTIASCYALWWCRNATEASLVQERLAEEEIEFRLWYGAGLHSHPHYRDTPRDQISVTTQLAPLILGLPVAPDLPESAIERVVTVLDSAVRGSL